MNNWASIKWWSGVIGYDRGYININNSYWHFMVTYIFLSIINLHHNPNLKVQTHWCLSYWTLSCHRYKRSWWQKKTLLCQWTLNIEISWQYNWQQWYNEHQYVEDLELLNYHGNLSASLWSCSAVLRSSLYHNVLDKLWIRQVSMIYE